MFLSFLLFEGYFEAARLLLLTSSELLSLDDFILPRDLALARASICVLLASLSIAYSRESSEPIMLIKISSI